MDLARGAAFLLHGIIPAVPHRKARMCRSLASQENGPGSARAGQADLGRRFPQTDPAIINATPRETRPIVPRSGTALEMVDE
jgi:hypothetical protein